MSACLALPLPMPSLTSSTRCADHCTPPCPLTFVPETLADLVPLPSLSFDRPRRRQEGDGGGEGQGRGGGQVVEALNREGWILCLCVQWRGSAFKRGRERPRRLGSRFLYMLDCASWSGSIRVIERYQGRSACSERAVVDRALPLANRLSQLRSVRPPASPSPPALTATHLTRTPWHH